MNLLGKGGGSYWPHGPTFCYYSWFTTATTYTDSTANVCRDNEIRAVLYGNRLHATDQTENETAEFPWLHTACCFIFGVDNDEDHFLLLNHIVTSQGFAWLIIMGSGFDNWVYWHFFTITVNYKSSHIELLLNDVCVTNALCRISDSCLNLSNSRINSLLYLPSSPNISHHVEQLIVFYYSVSSHGNLFFSNLPRGNDCSLLFVVAEIWFPRRCSAMDVCSGSTIPVFSHVTIFFSLYI
jgi:hypothetical protein